MIHETRSIDPDGRAVLSRHADDDGDRARLRHEAMMLALARHPGVVEIVTSDPDGVGLVTAAPTTDTLADLAGRPDLALEALAASAEIVADLHALGIVHGDITADAIVVSTHRPPTLGGFHRAGLAGELDVDGEILAPSRDVAALVRLVAAALDARAGSRTRRPIRSTWHSRSTRSSRSARSGDPGAAEGGGLARVLRDADDGRWPPARRLARAIEDELPARRAEPVGRPRRRVADGQGPVASTDATDDATDPFARLRPRDEIGTRRAAPRLLTVAAAAAGVVAITWGAMSLGLDAGGSRQGARPHSNPATTEVALPTTAAILRARPQVSVAHDGIVAVGAIRYAVGRPGDDVAVADWGCRGAVRALVLRPATGEIFVFVGWATAAHAITAQPAGRVTPGSRLAVSADGRGCATASALDPGGRAQRIDPGQA